MAAVCTVTPSAVDRAETGWVSEATMFAVGEPRATTLIEMVMLPADTVIVMSDADTPRSAAS